MMNTRIFGMRNTYSNWPDFLPFFSTPNLSEELPTRTHQLYFDDMQSYHIRDMGFVFPAQILVTSNGLTRLSDPPSVRL